MESSLRARIAVLVADEPALADDLTSRGTLIEIIGLADLDIGELRLPADLVRARLADGVPLLDRLDAPIPPSAFMLVERLTVAMLADPTARPDAETMLAALRSHRLHGEQLVGEAVVGHDDHLTALAASAGVADRLVMTVADLGSRAVLQAVAQRLRPALALGAWNRAYCPVCGGLPILGERAIGTSVAGSASDESSEVLRLRCGRCASSWAHTLPLCPDCATGRFSVIDDGDEMDFDGWELATCDTCPEYLKIAPSARSERLPDLLIDDLETWSLDRWAVEQGFQRRGGVGYRLEHGEDASEELVDD